MVPKEKKISFDGDLIGKMVPAKWKISLAGNQDMYLLNSSLAFSSKPSLFLNHREMTAYQ